MGQICLRAAREHICPIVLRDAHEILALLESHRGQRSAEILLDSSALRTRRRTVHGGYSRQNGTHEIEAEMLHGYFCGVGAKRTDDRWQILETTPHAWERDALEFVRLGLPDHDPYRAWANFEYMALDGSLNEVDLLVASPAGFFLVEIKSRPSGLR